MYRKYKFGFVVPSSALYGMLVLICRKLKDLVFRTYCLPVGFWTLYSYTLHNIKSATYG